MSNSLGSPLDLILGRRSIRAYAPGEVTDEQIRKMLEAAMSAPSAVAKDPWHFIVVRKRAMLERIGSILPNGQMISGAAVGIVVCGDLEVAHDRQISYLLQDCAAAMENLLLAVHALGLGACWLGVHPREDRIGEVRKAFGLPLNVIPVCCAAIGQPGEVKEARTRFKAGCVHQEKW